MAILVRENTDANKFFNAAGIARTEANSSIIIAISQLTTDLKSYGIWDKMKAIYPFVGQPGVSSSFEFNLKNPNTFRGTFYGGWTFASTGITGNGINAYFDSNFNQSLNLTPSNNHISIYSRTDFNSPPYPNLKVDCGVTDNTSFAFTEIQSSVATFANFINGSQNPTQNVLNSLGQFTGVGNVSNATIYKNGVNLQTDSNTQTRAMFNATIYFGATHDAIADVARYFSPREYAFASIGDGLTDTEAANLYTAVQRFQTTLGRQV